MSQNQHHSHNLLSMAQNTFNRRSSSALGQMTYNNPPISQLNSHSPLKHISLQPASAFPMSRGHQSKENQTPYSGQYTFESRNDDAGKRLRMENERLRSQLQQQKRSYQSQIARLKQNIARKDSLLDQCESQIYKLKDTYLKFIAQQPKQQPSQYQNPLQIIKSNPTHKFEPKSSDKQPGTPQSDSNLIPLSIQTKSSSSCNLSQGSGHKLSHGLMKRIV